MQIIRHKNRLEKLIQRFIKKETKPRKVRFWGQLHSISPALVSQIQGDGLQVVYLEPIDTRPDHYVLRIDSSIDVRADSFDYEEMLLCAAEDEFGKITDYNEDYIDGKYSYRRWDADDNEPWEDESAVAWPMVRWGGGMWGVLKNFKTKNQKAENES